MTVITETEIALTTPDGAMPVKIFAPESSRGGLILYMDAFGWRSELDRLCRMYAERGYTTFLPDLFWRQGSLRFRPTRSADEPLDPAMVAANLATSMDMTVADTGAILARFAGTGPGRRAKFGTVGYCMGARHALAAAVAYPDAIRYAACLHGGRMVSEGACSPHLLIPKVTGRLYLAFAKDDDTCPPEHQDILRRALGPRGEAECFDAEHGWTFPDRWCHDPAAAAAVHARVLEGLEAEVARTGGRAS